MGNIMLINKIKYHKVICQGVFKQGKGAGFRKRETPGSGQRLDFPKVSQRRIKNGDINGMFHIL